MLEYAKLYFKAVFKLNFERTDFLSGVILAILGAVDHSKPELGLNMEVLSWQTPLLFFGLVFLFRILTAPYYLWKEQKENCDKVKNEKIESNTKTLSLTTDENQVSCAKFVNGLYSGLIDNWVDGAYVGNTVLNRPYEHVCYRKLQYTQSDLRVDESTRNKIQEYLKYFICEGDLHLGVAGECRIETVFKTEKELLKNKDKIKELATELAKDLHYVTR